MFVFLNTPNSIQTADTINKTKSPWIYHETVISRLIRKKKLSECRGEATKAFTDLGRLMKVLRIMKLTLVIFKI